MPLGSITIGTGNITTTTTSSTVTGIGTTFITQFKAGSLIADISNVFVGYVSYIASNTSLSLTTVASLNITDQRLHYAPMLANSIVYTYYTSGRVTANTASKIVTGNSTKFATELNYGDSLWIASTVSGPNTFVGTVDLITSDTQLYLNAKGLANIDNQKYYILPPVYEKNSPFGGPATAFEEPNVNAGILSINNQLFNWVNTGLIPNTSVVNSYHPPIRDGITGILVNLPATIYTKKGNSTAVLSTYSLGTKFNSSGSDYTVHDFDKNQSAFGTDVGYVRNSLHRASDIEHLVNAGDRAAYNGAIGSLVSTTSADRYAKLANINLPRVTDSLDSAKEYYSQTSPTAELKEHGGTNLGNNQESRLRPQPQNLRKVVATGAPIAVPGMLNVIADTYKPGDITWVPPKFKPTNVS
jgi:hypothetical protein